MKQRISNANDSGVFRECYSPLHSTSCSTLFEPITGNTQLGLVDSSDPAPNDFRFGEVDSSPGTVSSEKREQARIRSGTVLEDDSRPKSSDSNPLTIPKLALQRNSRLAVDLTYGDEPSSLWIRLKRFVRNVWSSLKMIRLFLSLAWRDMKKRTCSYCLGFFSVLVIVLLCVLMISLLTNMPILFLHLSEATRGEFDLRISPGGVMTSATSVNYTFIKELFPPSDKDHHLHAPRIEQVLNARQILSCRGKNASSLWYSLNGTLCSGQEVCMSECAAVDWTTVNVIAIDTAAERRIGLGSQYSQPAPGEGEVILSHRAAIQMGGAPVGVKVAIYGDPQRKMKQPFRNFKDTSTADVIMVFTVIAIMDLDERKFPSMSSFAVVSYYTFLKDVAKGLRPDTSPDNVAAVANTNPEECASAVYFIMEPYKRLVSYRSTSYNTIRRRVVAWASGILSPLGFMQVDRQTPQLWGLWSTRMMSVFLGLIISVILLALAFLSIVLIYALLTVGIGTKTYELGIQRMVGFTKENLVVLVLTNAYSFTIPAWLLGLVAGQAVYVGIRQLFITLIDMTLPIGVTGASIGWATLAGLGIPILASFFPILALVKQKLPVALNTSRGRTVGVIFEIRRNDSSQLNGAMFGLGVLLFIFSFLVYFLFPTGLITMNLTLIFYIFFAILIGLLAGLVLLSLNFERVCQVSLSYLMLFWENKAVFSFMQKSLSAHRARNRKTTLMYSLSLAFVIFITVAVEIELVSVDYTARQKLGCEIRISTDFLTMQQYWEVEEHLERYVRNGLIAQYTYEYSINDLAGMSMEKLSSLGRYRTSRTAVTPLPPNYYEALGRSFLLVNSADKLVGQYGLLQSLYSEEGMRKGILSSGAAKFLGVGNAEGVLLYTVTHRVNMTSKETDSFMVPARPVATLDLSPVMTMSKYSFNATSFLVSIPSAFYQINLPYNSVLEGVITSIRLHVQDKGTFKEIVDKMTAVMSSIDRTSTITTITDQTKDMARASGILKIFFIIVELMILVICFFSLMSSMTTNVLNSSKEIGVLLCMGINHFQVYRVYVWEAFILVVASGIVGLIIGVLVAYTILLQQILFSQISFPFPFPYVQLCIVIGIGFLSALASSISPVAYLLGMPSVTHILRRLIT